MDFLQEIHSSDSLPIRGLGPEYRDYVLKQARFLEWAQNGFTEERLRTLLTTPINDEAHYFIKNFEMPTLNKMVQSLEELEEYTKAASKLHHFQDFYKTIYFIKYLQMLITSKCRCRRDNFEVENVIKAVMNGRKLDKLSKENVESKNNDTL